MLREATRPRLSQRILGRFTIKTYVICCQVLANSAVLVQLPLEGHIIDSDIRVLAYIGTKASLCQWI
jgi:hypothetical protein